MALHVSLLWRLKWAVVDSLLKHQLVMIFSTLPCFLVSCIARYTIPPPFCSAVLLRLPTDTVRRAVADAPLHLRFSNGHDSVDAPNQVLRSPGGRKGKAKGSSVYTCDELEAALNNYLGA